jgi:hypothetical protein
MLLTATLILSLSAGADLTPEKAAEIANDQAKAQAAVSAKYGNKKSTELTPDERRAMIKDQADADRKALDKHGISVKDWARYEQTQGRADYAAQKTAVKQLQEKEKAAAAAAAKGDAAGPKEIPIQRGFSDENPVVMEEKKGAAPRVDTSIAPGEMEGMDGQSGDSAKKKVPPPLYKKGSKKKGGRRHR